MPGVPVVHGVGARGTMELDQIDLTDLELFAEGFPHGVFRHLRREAPVWWHEPTDHTPDGEGFWVLSRHADVLTAVSDATTFSSERAPGRKGGGTLIQDLPYGVASGVLLNMTDDPRHRRVRGLLTPSVSPRALAAMEPELRARTAELVEAAVEAEQCDFLTAVAAELPVQASLQLLGVPAEDRHQLVSWSGATLAYDDRELGEETEATRSAAASMAAYAEDLIAEKRRCPTGDLLSILVSSRIEGDGGEHGPLSTAELSMTFSLLVAAGSETTRNAIALGVAALAEHPDQLALLRGDRSLVGSAVEEILRWSSPTLYNRRTATGDAEIGGVRVLGGQKVTLWWASADFDESVFEEPDRFDLRRDPNPHLAFGSRSHFCLGAGLARLEIRLVLEELLDRVGSIELTGPIRRVRTNKHAGVARMPVRLSRGDPTP
jgi:cytochrome P450